MLFPWGLRCNLLAELLEDGFGDTPFYHCIIAELQGKNSSDGKNTLLLFITETHTHSPPLTEKPSPERNRYRYVFNKERRFFCLQLKSFGYLLSLFESVIWVSSAFNSQTFLSLMLWLAASSTCADRQCEPKLCTACASCFCTTTSDHERKQHLDVLL